MKRSEIKVILEKITASIATITDPNVVATLQVLTNLVETLAEQNFAYQEENQKLKDEVNRLKGEQGRPDFKKQSVAKTDHSSEDERKKRNNKKSRKPKKSKKNSIKIDKIVKCEVDKNILPADAIFKGFETRIMQELKIVTENVEYLVAVYYSKSLNKTFLGELPTEYRGDFGAGIHSLVISLYRDSGMTEPAIERFLHTFNVDISSSTISRMLTEHHEVFHQEKEDIVNAGLTTAGYQQMDDTGAKVNGKNHHAHILCNPYYTAYFTRPKKDRLTLLELLCRGELKFVLNRESYELMAVLGLSAKRLVELKQITAEQDKYAACAITSSNIDDILNRLFPNPKKHSTSRRIIREASAIVYYRDTEGAITYLMVDDAPQFNLIAKYKLLCWIHEGRHYKKLNPVVECHRKMLDNVIEQFWDYYQKLLDYKQTPSSELAVKLSKEFDCLFSTVTGYDALDKRLVKTLARKESLLLVLDHPDLPLHNNASELGARVQARIRDINLQTISENGTKAKDTFATIVQTAKKLGVNSYNYIYDRISQKLEMPSLASLIMDSCCNAKFVPT